ncbi:hypothetical protein D3C87_1681910 [compost metagenome]
MTQDDQAVAPVHIKLRHQNQQPQAQREMRDHQRRQQDGLQHVLAGKAHALDGDGQRGADEQRQERRPDHHDQAGAKALLEVRVREHPFKPA